MGTEVYRDGQLKIDHRGQEAQYDHTRGGFGRLRIRGRGGLEAVSLAPQRSSFRDLRGCDNRHVPIASWSSATTSIPQIHFALFRHIASTIARTAAMVSINWLSITEISQQYIGLKEVR